MLSCLVDLTYIKRVIEWLRWASAFSNEDDLLAHLELPSPCNFISTDFIIHCTNRFDQHDACTSKLGPTGAQKVWHTCLDDVQLRKISCEAWISTCSRDATRTNYTVDTLTFWQFCSRARINRCLNILVIKDCCLMFNSERFPSFLKFYIKLLFCLVFLERYWIRNRSVP